MSIASGSLVRSRGAERRRKLCEQSRAVNLMDHVTGQNGATGTPSTAASRALVQETRRMVQFINRASGGTDAMSFKAPAAWVAVGRGGAAAQDLSEAV